jgi:hypothetical protein
MAKLIELEHTHFNFHYIVCARPNTFSPFTLFPHSLMSVLRSNLGIGGTQKKGVNIKKPLAVGIEIGGAFLSLIRLMMYAVNVI